MAKEAVALDWILFRLEIPCEISRKSCTRATRIHVVALSQPGQRNLRFKAQGLLLDIPRSSFACFFIFFPVGVDVNMLDMQIYIYIYIVCLDYDTDLSFMESFL